MRHFPRALIGCAVLAYAVSAFAQTRDVTNNERPYRGLFGTELSDPEHLLAIQGSVGGGRDDNVLTGSGLGGGTPYNLVRTGRGEYGYGFAGVTYVLQRRHMGIDAQADSAARYYPNLADRIVRTHRGDFSISLAGEHTQLAIGQSVAYRPHNLLELFPSAAASQGVRAEAPDEDFAISENQYLTYQTRASVTRQLGKRSALAADYTFSRSDLSARSATGRDLLMQGAGGTFSFDLKRGLAMRLGYHYRERGYMGEASGEKVRTHALDAGIGYARQLSLTRRTTLSIGSGSSAVAATNRTIYRLTGEARLNREIGRTWNGWIGYERNVALLETFDEPFFYDAIASGIEGLVSRRLQIQTLAEAARGYLGYSTQRPHETYSGTARLTFAITRHIATSASYLYYHYTFLNSAGLPPGVPPQLNRQGVRVDVSFWAPLLYRARKP